EPRPHRGEVVGRLHVPRHRLAGLGVAEPEAGRVQQRTLRPAPVRDRAAVRRAGVHPPAAQRRPPPAQVDPPPVRAAGVEPAPAANAPNSSTTLTCVTARFPSAVGAVVLPRRPSPRPRTNTDSIRPGFGTPRVSAR